MSVSGFIAYFSIVFFATIIPGPSMLLALNHGANHGIAKTIYSGLGNLLGNLLMALLSILGLGVLLLASGLVFNIIKWIGIAYLVYLGLRMIVEPLENQKSESISTKITSAKSVYRLFIDGFVVAIGNPKGILFFTALFPQFIDVNSASLNRFITIFITLGLVAFGCYMLYASFGFKLNSLFRLKPFRKIYNRITGSLFIGIGIALAFSKK